MPMPLKQSLTCNLGTEQPNVHGGTQCTWPEGAEGRRLAPARCVSAWAFQKALLGVAPQPLCPELTDAAYRDSNVGNLSRAPLGQLPSRAWRGLP